MKLIIVATLLLTLVSCSQAPTAPSKPLDPQPMPSQGESPQELKLGKKLKLWSTYYFTPLFASQSSGYPLRDKNGKALTGNLSLDHWCMIGLQGTGAVDGVTFTYQSRSKSQRVPCEKSFLRRASFASSTGDIKFFKDSTKYGSGNRSNALEPYKSIACDQSIYKFGQRFYIPAAKGAVMPDGSLHDGIFRCDDIGGAIKGNHIDTFIGFLDMRGKDFSKRYSIAFSQMPEKMRQYIKSTSSATFDAYLID